MEFNTFNTKIRKMNSWVSLHFIGDTHIGQGNHNREKLLERIKTIKKDPQALWMGMGDYGDHIYYTDPRFDLNSMDDNITVGELRSGILGQIHKFCKDFEPIKDKCIGISTGNHEETIFRKYHVDPAREIAYRLNANYAGYCAITKIGVSFHTSDKGGYPIKLFTHHGYGGGRKHGAQINKIEDALRVCPSADIFAMGHVHGKVVSALDTIDITGHGNMIAKQKIFVVTSSFAESYKQGALSFAEKNMFTQASIGGPVVYFKKVQDGHFKKDGKKPSQSTTRVEMKVTI